MNPNSQAKHIYGLSCSLPTSSQCFSPCTVMVCKWWSMPGVKGMLHSARLLPLPGQWFCVPVLVITNLCCLHWFYPTLETGKVTSEHTSTTHALNGSEMLVRSSYFNSPRRFLNDPLFASVSVILFLWVVTKMTRCLYLVSPVLCDSIRFYNKTEKIFKSENWKIIKALCVPLQGWFP